MDNSQKSTHPMSNSMGRVASPNRGVMPASSSSSSSYTARGTGTLSRLLNQRQAPPSATSRSASVSSNRSAQSTSSQRSASVSVSCFSEVGFIPSTRAPAKANAPLRPSANEQQQRKITSHSNQAPGTGRRGLTEWVKDKMRTYPWLKNSIKDKDVLRAAMDIGKPFYDSHTKTTDATWKQGALQPLFLAYAESQANLKGEEQKITVTRADGTLITKTIGSTAASLLENTDSEIKNLVSSVRKCIRTKKKKELATPELVRAALQEEPHLLQHPLTPEEVFQLVDKMHAPKKLREDRGDSWLQACVCVPQMVKPHYADLLASEMGKQKMLWLDMNQIWIDKLALVAHGMHALSKGFPVDEQMDALHQWFQFSVDMREYIKQGGKVEDLAEAEAKTTHPGQGSAPTDEDLKNLRQEAIKGIGMVPKEGSATVLGAHEIKCPKLLETRTIDIVKDVWAPVYNCFEVLAKEVDQVLHDRTHVKSFADEVENLYDACQAAEKNPQDQEKRQKMLDCVGVVNAKLTGCFMSTEPKAYEKAMCALIEVFPTGMSMPDGLRCRRPYLQYEHERDKFQKMGIYERYKNLDDATKTNLIGGHPVKGKALIKQITDNYRTKDRGVNIFLDKFVHPWTQEMVDKLNHTYLQNWDLVKHAQSMTMGKIRAITNALDKNRDVVDYTTPTGYRALEWHKMHDIGRRKQEIKDNITRYKFQHNQTYLMRATADWELLKPWVTSTKKAIMDEKSVKEMDDLINAANAENKILQTKIQTETKEKEENEVTAVLKSHQKGEKLVKAAMKTAKAAAKKLLKAQKQEEEQARLEALENEDENFDDAIERMANPDILDGGIIDDELVHEADPALKERHEQRELHRFMKDYGPEAAARRDALMEDFGLPRTVGEGKSQTSEGQPMGKTAAPSTGLLGSGDQLQHNTTTAESGFLFPTTSHGKKPLQEVSKNSPQQTASTSASSSTTTAQTQQAAPTTTPLTADNFTPAEISDDQFTPEEAAQCGTMTGDTHDLFPVSEVIDCEADGEKEEEEEDPIETWRRQYDARYPQHGAAAAGPSHSAKVPSTSTAVSSQLATGEGAPSSTSAAAGATTTSESTSTANDEVVDCENSEDEEEQGAGDNNLLESSTNAGSCKKGKEPTKKRKGNAKESKAEAKKRKKLDKEIADMKAATKEMKAIRNRHQLECANNIGELQAIVKNDKLMDFITELGSACVEQSDFYRQQNPDFKNKLDSTDLQQYLPVLSRWLPFLEKGFFRTSKHSCLLNQSTLMGQDYLRFRHERTLRPEIHHSEHDFGRAQGYTFSKVTYEAFIYAVIDAEEDVKESLHFDSQWLLRERKRKVFEEKVREYFQDIANAVADGDQRVLEAIKDTSEQAVCAELKITAEKNEEESPKKQNIYIQPQFAPASDGTARLVDQDGKDVTSTSAQQDITTATSASATESTSHPLPSAAVAVLDAKHGQPRATLSPTPKQPPLPKQSPAPPTPPATGEGSALWTAGPQMANGVQTRHNVTSTDEAQVRSPPPPPAPPAAAAKNGGRKRGSKGKAALASTSTTLGTSGASTSAISATAVETPDVNALSATESLGQPNAQTVGGSSTSASVANVDEGEGAAPVHTSTSSSLLGGGLQGASEPQASDASGDGLTAATTSNKQQPNGDVLTNDDNLFFFEAEPDDSVAEPLISDPMGAADGEEMQQDDKVEAEDEQGEVAGGAPSSEKTPVLKNKRAQKKRNERRAAMADFKETHILSPLKEGTAEDAASSPEREPASANNKRVAAADDEERTGPPTKVSKTGSNPDAHAEAEADRRSSAGSSSRASETSMKKRGRPTGSKGKANTAKAKPSPKPKPGKKAAGKKAAAPKKRGKKGSDAVPLTFFGVGTDTNGAVEAQVIAPAVAPAHDQEVEREKEEESNGANSGAPDTAMEGENDNEDQMAEAMEQQIAADEEEADIDDLDAEAALPF
ncbi:unnamed protein product [Amoebophrya sp. A25]|nr:unnamed protein product [Amoebophrya sp. A25]|eukprot:GSA25T00006690001.1